MKRQSRFCPVFTALSLFLTTGSLPAAAQMRAQLGAGYSAVVPAVPAISGSIMPSVGSLSNGLTPMDLNGCLAAPNVALSPIATLIPFAAAPAPAALTVMTQQAAAHAGVSAVSMLTAKTAGPGLNVAAVSILDTFRRSPADSISFDGARKHDAVAIEPGATRAERAGAASPLKRFSRAASTLGAKAGALTAMIAVSPVVLAAYPHEIAFQAVTSAFPASVFWATGVGFIAGAVAGSFLHNDSGQRPAPLPIILVGAAAALLAGGATAVYIGGWTMLALIPIITGATFALIILAPDSPLWTTPLQLGVTRFGGPAEKREQKASRTFERGGIYRQYSGRMALWGKEEYASGGPAPEQLTRLRYALGEQYGDFAHFPNIIEGAALLMRSLPGHPGEPGVIVFNGLDNTRKVRLVGENIIAPGLAPIPLREIKAVKFFSGSVGGYDS